MFQEQQMKSLASYQAQGRKTGRRSRVEDASERKMPVFKLRDARLPRLAKEVGPKKPFPKNLS